MNNRQNPKIGVVTVTFNSADVIDGFMNSLTSQTFDDFRTYIVDNNSLDSTIQKIENYRSDLDIVVMANRENVGVAAGNNQGILAALSDGCEFVLLINNDTKFEPTTYNKLLEGIVNFGCEATVPKMMYFGEKNKIWFAGGGFIKWKAYANYHVGKDELDHGQYDTAVQVTYAPTCCMLIKKEVFDLVGLMDEKYFVYYDDTDFCLRMMNAGIKMFYLPNIDFLHKVSSLTGKDSNFTIRYMVRNKVYYIRKQKSHNIFYIIMFYMKNIFDLLFSIRYQCNFKTFTLVNRSFYEGLLM